MNWFRRLARNRRPEGELPAHKDAAAGSRADLRVIVLTSGLHGVAAGTIVALLAALQSEHGLPTWGLGLIIGVGFLTGAVGFLVFPRYADLGFARPLMVLATPLTTASLVWIGFASGLWELVAARALLGLADGLFIPSARRVLIDWRPDQPGAEIGRLLSAWFFGFIIGPPVAAVIASGYGLTPAFVVPALILLAVTPLLQRVRPASVSVRTERIRARLLLRRRLVILGLMIAVPWFLLAGVLDALWAVMLTDLGASTVYIGLTFAIALLPTAVLIPIGGRLADKFGAVKVAVLSLACSVPFVWLYGQTATPTGLVLVAFFMGPLVATLEPSAAAIVARGSPPEELATGQGLLEAVGFTATAVGAIAAAFIFDLFGREWLFTGLAALTAAAALAAWIEQRKHE